MIAIVLTYDEIENILGLSLPDTAYKRDAWLSNNSDNHSQAKSWLEAVWKAKELKLGDSVTFYDFGLFSII
jgi:hypothetical protein